MSDEPIELEVPVNSLCRVLQLATAMLKDSRDDFEACREVARFIEQFGGVSFEEKTPVQFVEWAWEFIEAFEAEGSEEDLKTAEELIDKFEGGRNLEE